VRRKWYILAKDKLALGLGGLEITPVIIPERPAVNGREAGMPSADVLAEAIIGDRVKQKFD
jgi:hypothetical protein